MDTAGVGCAPPRPSPHPRAPSAAGTAMGSSDDGAPAGDPALDERLLVGGQLGAVHGHLVGGDLLVQQALFGRAGDDSSAAHDRIVGTRPVVAGGAASCAGSP